MIWILFIILALYLVLDFLYRRTARYKNKFEDMKKINDYKKTPVEFINIGSTQARYAYEYEGVMGLNLATNEQSVEYSFLMLKKYLPYLKRGGKVIISVSDMDLLLSSDLQERKYKYFGVLPVEKRTLIKNILFPLLFSINEIKYIFKDEKLYNKFELDKNILKDDNEKAEDCKRRIERWKKYGVISFDINTGFNIINKNIDRNIEIIKNIIRFCKNEGYGVIVVTPPVSPFFGEYFRDSFKDILNRPLEELGIKENIEYYDFTKEEKFKEESLFLNTVCLNKNGRRKFTDIIVKSSIYN